MFHSQSFDLEIDEYIAGTSLFNFWDARGGGGGGGEFCCETTKCSVNNFGRVVFLSSNKCIIVVPALKMS